MTVEGLRSPSGEEYPVAAVLSGLRGLLTEPEPVRLPRPQLGTEPAVVVADVSGGLVVALDGEVEK